jgi:hypothetical protein
MSAWLCLTNFAFEAHVIGQAELFADPSRQSLPSCAQSLLTERPPSGQADFWGAEHVQEERVQPWRIRNLGFARLRKVLDCHFAPTTVIKRLSLILPSSNGAARHAAAERAPA